MSPLARRLAVMVTSIVVLGIVTASSSSASSTPRLTATLGSRSIAPGDVGRYHCHDLDHPRIRCFRTSAALMAAVAAKAPATGAEVRRPGALLGLNYVRVFQHVGFAGASAYLSVSYSDLRAIGWNDAISSYYVVNSGSGTFFQNIGYGGVGTNFCCNQSVTNVGSSLNDTFSSVSGSA